jgi:hypothetical protein
MSYFSPAMRMMRERLDHPHFFVFSDDTDWCEHHFPAHDTTVVGHEHKGAKFANYLQLMASCRHFIIPNSTFAWWAIWLSNNPQKCVIAPSHWFADPKQKTSDMIPSDWLRIDN